MTVLITGGAGYIGSHMALSLLDRGERVCILDNLSTGDIDNVPAQARFFQGDVANHSLVRWILADNDVEAVLHFAGSAVVPDSVADPLAYYRNNTTNSRDLLEACVASGVRRFIFSSTAAVYGAGGDAPIPEDHPTEPLSPYGRSKLMTEWMIADAARAGDLSYVILRYFNVAGADPRGRAGQSTPRATHLIKRACQAALGLAPALEIFGTDYPTPDGTGIRDYIHVSDLVEAHALALDHLRADGASGTFNCGYGSGFSVREVVQAVERASGRPTPTKLMPRRPGDAASVIADPSELKNRLGWRPRFDDLDLIAGHAFAWEGRKIARPSTQDCTSAGMVQHSQLLGEYIWSPPNIIT